MVSAAVIVILFCVMFGEEGVPVHRQEKASSDPPVATPFLFALYLYKFHPLAQNLHHHVALTLEARFHHAGYALYGMFP
jgi:hypothetical protein